MTVQNFEDVFQKISLSMGVLDAFRGTEVRRLTIHKKERTVSMEIAAQVLIPLQKWEDLRGELLKHLPGIREVDIDITYEIAETSPEELAEGYWESIKTFVSSQSKVCAGVIADAEWKIIDGKMQIFVKNNNESRISVGTFREGSERIFQTAGNRAQDRHKACTAHIETAAERRR